MLAIRFIEKYGFFLFVLFCVEIELGLVRFHLSSRVVVEDATLGADFWLTEVDGKPTTRVRHGFITTKVPLALVQPGNRMLLLTSADFDNENDRPFVIQAKIKNGQDYRIETGPDGRPYLSPIQH